LRGRAGEKAVIYWLIRREGLEGILEKPKEMASDRGWERLITCRKFEGKRKK